MTCCTHLNFIPGLQSFCPTCKKTFEPCQHKEHYHYGKRTATKSAATQANPRANQRRQGLEQKRTRSSRQQKTQSDHGTNASVDQQRSNQTPARGYIQTVLPFDTPRTIPETVPETPVIKPNLNPQNARCKFTQLWAGEEKEVEGELIENPNRPAGMVEVKYEAYGQERQSQVWIWNLIEAPNLIQLLETEHDCLQTKATQFPWLRLASVYPELIRVEKRLAELLGSQAPSTPGDAPPEQLEVTARQIRLEDELARLELERDRLLVEGPISSKGAWIEKYTAKRKRKKSPPKVYIYYRLRQREGIKHQSLGKPGSPKYNVAREAIARRNALERIERRIKIVEKQLEEQG